MLVAHDNFLYGENSGYAVTERGIYTGQIFQPCYIPWKTFLETELESTPVRPGSQFYYYLQFFDAGSGLLEHIGSNTSANQIHNYLINLQAYLKSSLVME